MIITRTTLPDFANHVATCSSSQTNESYTKLSDQNDLNKDQSRNDLFEIFLERPTGLGIVADVANRIISSYQTRRGLSIGKTF